MELTKASATVSNVQAKIYQEKCKEGYKNNSHHYLLYSLAPFVQVSVQYKNFYFYESDI